MAPRGQFDFSYFEELIDRGLRHAVFDLENTIVRSDITELYFFIKKHQAASRFRYSVWKKATLAAWGPLYLGLDHLKREWFQRAFYKRFEPFSMGELNHYSSLYFQEVLRERFIPYVHDLVFLLKKKEVDVSLLSTSTGPVVSKVGEYFHIPYHCLQIHESGDGCRVDLSGLKNFKLNHIKGFDPESTLVVADSKHDLPVLSYVRYPVVVGPKRQRWMRGLNGRRITEGAVEDI